MSDNSRFETSLKQALILDILHRYYPDIYRMETLRQIFIIATQKEPLYVRLGRTHLLINKDKKFAVSNNLSYILDYCASSSNNRLPIRSNALNAYAYQLNLQNMRRLGATEYPLHPLLWQIFSKLLPETIHFEPHDLALKMRCLPNFDVIGQVPSHVMAMTGSCEHEKKTVSELHHLYPNVAESEIHRFFLLSLLTGALDIDVLSQSLDRQELKMRERLHNKAKKNKKELISPIASVKQGKFEKTTAGSGWQKFIFSSGFLSNLFKKS